MLLFWLQLQSKRANIESKSMSLLSSLSTLTTESITYPNRGSFRLDWLLFALNRRSLLLKTMEDLSWRLNDLFLNKLDLFYGRYRKQSELFSIKANAYWISLPIASDRCANVLTICGATQTAIGDRVSRDWHKWPLIMALFAFCGHRLHPNHYYYFNDKTLLSKYSYNWLIVSAKWRNIEPKEWNISLGII